MHDRLCSLSWSARQVRGVVANVLEGKAVPLALLVVAEPHFSHCPCVTVYFFKSGRKCCRSKYRPRIKIEKSSVDAIVGDVSKCSDNVRIRVA